jgi:inhibitor of cysteine peptidase
VVESAIKTQDGVGRSLADQYLVSCNTEGWGCNGGWWAFDYFADKVPPGEPAAGAVYEADFPYQAADVACNPPHPHHEEIASWSYVDSWDSVPSVATLKQAIYDHGPVAAAVCVGSAFHNYDSGVFDTEEGSSCPNPNNPINHGVVLVGWDDTRGSNGAWRLKNSWGAYWGEGGYMWIEYGTSNVGFGAAYVNYTAGATPETCPWPDLDCSGSVDVADIQAVANSWRCKQGEACYQAEYDIDGDGIVTIVDIMRMAAEWG